MAYSRYPCVGVQGVYGIITQIIHQTKLYAAQPPYTSVHAAPNKQVMPVYARPRHSICTPYLFAFL
jgi:hypothetical protein